MLTIVCPSGMSPEREAGSGINRIVSDLVIRNLALLRSTPERKIATEGELVPLDPGSLSFPRLKFG
jgi:hypothetical protein